MSRQLCGIAMMRQGRFALVLIAGLRQQRREPLKMPKLGNCTTSELLSVPFPPSDGQTLPYRLGKVCRQTEADAADASELLGQNLTKQRKYGQAEPLLRRL